MLANQTEQTIEDFLKLHKITVNYEPLKEVLMYQGDECNDFEHAEDIINHLDDDGSLHEIIDGQIDVYYYDLRKWVVENYNYVEEAMEEGLAEGETDFHKLIQIGQYVYYRELMSEAVDELRTDLRLAEEGE